MNATTSAWKRGIQIDPSITNSDDVYSLCSFFFFFTLRDESSNKKRWQGLRSNGAAQKQALFTQGFSVRFWWGRWLPWVTSGWNQLYKLFKRTSLVFTGMCEASKLPRCLAIFLFMFFTSNFLFPLKLFRTYSWSGNVGHWRCYCQTSIAPPPPPHTSLPLRLMYFQYKSVCCF